MPVKAQAYPLVLGQTVVVELATTMRQSGMKESMKKYVLIYRGDAKAQYPYADRLHIHWHVRCLRLTAQLTDVTSGR